MVSLPKRRCAHEPCGRRFQPTRKHHAFCSPECRKQHWISENTQEAERTRSRRLSRPLRAQIEVYPSDFTGDRRPAASLLRKILAAQKRLDERSPT